MASLTSAMAVRCVAGGKTCGQGLPELACGLLVPAAALVDGGRAVVAGVRQGVSWLRRAAARMLRRAAQSLDPVPAVPAPVPCFEYGADPVPEPVILPLPVVEPVAVAAQAPAAASLASAAVPVLANDVADGLRRALVEHGTVRGAARALGIAESTFRSRAKRAGVALPGRKGRK